MAEIPRTDPRLDEERLAHALISRGLLTRDEARSCRGSSAGGVGPVALLARLTLAGVLTEGQALRAKEELSTLLGQQIPGYHLMEKLGQGAMGVVYKARQASMDRLVAVKLLHPKLAADPEFLRRLTKEAHVAAKLSHNNIVQAIDVGSAGPLHYFVMELVEGKTIRQEMDAGKKYTEPRGARDRGADRAGASARGPARAGASRREAREYRLDGRGRGQAGRSRHGPRRGRYGAGEARERSRYRYALLHRSGTGARSARCGRAPISTRWAQRSIT